MALSNHATFDCRVWKRGKRQVTREANTSANFFDCWSLESLPCQELLSSMYVFDSFYAVNETRQRDPVWLELVPGLCAVFSESSAAAVK